MATVFFKDGRAPLFGWKTCFRSCRWVFLRFVSCFYFFIRATKDVDKWHLRHFALSPRVCDIFVVARADEKKKEFLSRSKYFPEILPPVTTTTRCGAISIPFSDGLGGKSGRNNQKRKERNTKQASWSFSNAFMTRVESVWRRLLRRISRNFLNWVHYKKIRKKRNKNNGRLGDPIGNGNFFFLFHSRKAPRSKLRTSGLNSWKYGIIKKYFEFWFVWWRRRFFSKPNFRLISSKSFKNFGPHSSSAGYPQEMDMYFEKKIGSTQQPTFHVIVGHENFGMFQRNWRWDTKDRLVFFGGILSQIVELGVLSDYLSNDSVRLFVCRVWTIKSTASSSVFSLSKPVQLKGNVIKRQRRFLSALRYFQPPLDCSIDGHWTRPVESPQPVLELFLLLTEFYWPFFVWPHSIEGCGLAARPQPSPTPSKCVFFRACVSTYFSFWTISPDIRKTGSPHSNSGQVNISCFNRARFSWPLFSFLALRRSIDSVPLWIDR